MRTLRELEGNFGEFRGNLEEILRDFGNNLREFGELGEKNFKKTLKGIWITCRGAEGDLEENLGELAGDWGGGVHWTCRGMQTIETLNSNGRYHLRHGVVIEYITTVGRIRRW